MKAASPSANVAESYTGAPTLAFQTRGTAQLRR